MGAPALADTAAAQPERLFNACATTESWRVPANAGPAEKSPDRSCGEGTITGDEVMPCTMRRPSYEAKKKVLSRRRGPPSVTPKSFCLKSETLGSKYPLEFTILLRTNS